MGCKSLSVAHQLQILAVVPLLALHIPEQYMRALQDARMYSGNRSRHANVECLVNNTSTATHAP